MPPTWFPATASAVSASSPKMLLSQADANPSSAARCTCSRRPVIGSGPDGSCNGTPMRICLPPAPGPGRLPFCVSILPAAPPNRGGRPGPLAAQRAIADGGSMSANHFVLRHYDVEVEYTVGVTPGIPALTYRDGSSPTRTFTEAEIATDETALGTVVSIPLLQTIDTGGGGFGFVLPDLDIPQGQSGHFDTVGVYEKFSGPDSFPKIPPSWRGIELHGTAQTVIVPL